MTSETRFLSFGHHATSLILPSPPKFNFRGVSLSTHACTVAIGRAAIAFISRIDSSFRETARAIGAGIEGRGTRSTKRIGAAAIATETVGAIAAQALPVAHT